MFGPLSFSLAPQVAKSRSVYNLLKPISDWYAQASGYRQMGLKYDDLLLEERDDVQKAIGRLNERESYDRMYRFRVASQASVQHKDLPKEQWIKKEDDVRYLKPHVEEVWKEDMERAKWDSIQVQKK
ncbi:cytochrome bd ubiquinol oxidase [Schizopora paradoxa]|uniref:Cytochrome b-c1 complex subunit 7 n=1 Tax=Schizopora paradoxa TaxID=27342 RepID=A0A0H2S2L7_9AGAM|nr:cytochrome bd ubiquinol oxidase [Schizopora paradoxa]